MSTNPDPPLVDVKVTNPVTFIKAWWKKVIGNEGIEFRFHIRPLTAIIMSAIIASIGFGVGRFTMPEGIEIPFFRFEDVTSPTPIATTDPWKDTAYTGTLHYTEATNTFYLRVTSSSELITLQVPDNIYLKDLVNQRILAVGKYNKSSKILVVVDAKSLEVLPKSPVPVPTTSPTPTPTETPEASSSATPEN